MVGFEKRYLGDGVYASFDGYQVWLHVNHHEAHPCVALEPAVIDAINRYFRDVTRPSEPDPDYLREDRDDIARDPFHPDNCGFDGPTGAE